MHRAIDRRKRTEPRRGFAATRLRSRHPSAWLWFLVAAALAAPAACEADRRKSETTNREAVRETPPDRDGSSASETTPAASTPSIDRSSFRSVVDLIALENQGALDDLQTVEVAIEDGPAYETPHRYRGWPLSALFEGRADLPDDRSKYAVQFIATDGYRATVPLEELAADQGVVAFRDLEAPEQADWQPFPEDYGTSNPAPFYLVWRDAGGSDNHRPWTYKLAAIGIAEKRTLWGDAFPAHDETLENGFGVFRRHCMKCHAVNRSGGSVGPELNVPMNVTEYWKSAHLRAYIRNPKSYRAGAEMPSMASEISESDTGALLRYLEGMKRAKVCSSAEECEPSRPEP